MNRSQSSAAELRRGEEAAWGPRPPGVDRPSMRLLSFMLRVQGALRGFASVELPNGLRLHDVAVFAGDKEPWATLPAKPLLDRERRQKLGTDGKPAFAPAAEWRRRELADRFSAAVVELLRAEFPDALGDTP